MSRFFVLFLSLGLLLGCAKVSHLQELLTLQDLAREQESQQQFVEEQDRKFDFLLDEINNGRLAQYTDKESVLKGFGPPVFSQEVKKEGKAVEQWLYRYARDFSAEDKVYMFFDEESTLTGWDYVPASKKGEDDEPDHDREAVSGEAKTTADP